MRRHKRRTPMAAFDQINMTPLLDLTFLLLNHQNMIFQKHPHLLPKNPKRQKVKKHF